MLNRKIAHLLAVGLLAVLAAAGSLAWGARQGFTGYPLDEAWIHQSIARNLAETGEMTHQLGDANTGLTSPAWSYLLSLGYLLGIDHRIWALGLGVLCLVISGWLVYRLSGRLPSRDAGPERAERAPKARAALLAGLFCAVEWHLVWATVSGMETLLFTALSLGLLEYYFGQLEGRQSRQGPASLQQEQVYVSAIGIGLLGGILAVTRVEGVVLAILVIVALAIYAPRQGRSRLKDRLLPAALSLISLGLLTVPFAAFNYRISGAPLPSSFFAKQAMLPPSSSLIVRYWSLLKAPATGAQVVLLPGLLYGAYRLLRQRAWSQAWPFLWMLGLPLGYSLLLPTAYQHGRYVTPIIPILILYGVWGTSQLVRPRSHRMLVRVSSRGLPPTVALLALIFGLQGAAAYGEDVGFVNEMVSMAEWIKESTEASDLLAAKESGAITYIASRQVVTMADLIAEADQTGRNSAELVGALQRRGVAYVVLSTDSAAAYAQNQRDPQLELLHCNDDASEHSTRHGRLCIYGVPPGNDL